MVKNNRQIAELTADYRSIADPLRDFAESNVALANLLARADALADSDPLQAALEGGEPIERLHRALRSCIIFSVEIQAISVENAELLHSLRCFARLRAYAVMRDVSAAKVQQAARSGKYGAPVLSDLMK